MTYKITVLVACMIFSTACMSDEAASEEKKTDAQTATTSTKTTDEVGNEIINIKSIRNEGYTVHSSTQIEKITNEFYCEGYKVETFVVKRQENQEVRSFDLTLKVNGKKIDLKPIIGNKSNLYGYSNLETHFSCVDHLVRIVIGGQPYTHDNKLALSTNIIDFLVDRNTGFITSTLIE